MLRQIVEQHFVKQLSLKGPQGIAQWISLCIPFYGPGFESQALNLGFLVYIAETNKIVVKRMDISKKEVGIRPYLTNLDIGISWVYDNRKGYLIISF